MKRKLSTPYSIFSENILHFRNKGKIKAFSDEGKQSSLPPDLKEILQEDLQKKGEMILEGNLKCQE